MDTTKTGENQVSSRDSELSRVSTTSADPYVPDDHLEIQLSSEGLHSALRDPTISASVVQVKSIPLSPPNQTDAIKPSLLLPQSATKSNPTSTPEISSHSHISFSEDSSKSTSTNDERRVFVLLTNHKENKSTRKRASSTRPTSFIHNTRVIDSETSRNGIRPRKQLLESSTALSISTSTSPQSPSRHASSVASSLEKSNPSVTSATNTANPEKAICKARKPAKFTVFSTPSSLPSRPSEKGKIFHQCFHFTIGLVSFAWFIHFLVVFLLGKDTIISALLPQPLTAVTWTQRILFVGIISIFAVVLLTPIVILAYELFHFSPSLSVYSHEEFPKLHSIADPTQHLLTHMERIQEAVHESLRTNTPLSTIPKELESQLSSSRVNLYAESGEDLLEAFFRQRVKKFKSVAKKYARLLEEIRSEQEQVCGSSELPKYLLCSPCLNQYNCPQVHFSHQGYRYHCQSYTPSKAVDNPQRKMSSVNFYKDNNFVLTGLKERKPLNWSSPNDFPRRNLHAFIAQRYPAVPDGIDAFHPPRPELKQQTPVPKSVYTGRYCPEDDPCPSCAIDPLPVRHSARQEPPPVKDCCGNRILKNNRIQFQDKPTGFCFKVHGKPSLSQNEQIQDQVRCHNSSMQPESKACGPNIIYVNYNFDYGY